MGIGCIALPQTKSGSEAHWAVRSCTTDDGSDALIAQGNSEDVSGYDPLISMLGIDCEKCSLSSDIS